MPKFDLSKVNDIIKSYIDTNKVQLITEKSVKDIQANISTKTSPQQNIENSRSSITRLKQVDDLYKNLLTHPKLIKGINNLVTDVSILSNIINSRITQLKLQLSQINEIEEPIEDYGQILMKTKYNINKEYIIYFTIFLLLQNQEIRKSAKL